TIGIDGEWEEEGSFDGVPEEGRRRQLRWSTRRTKKKVASMEADERKERQLRWKNREHPQSKTSKHPRVVVHG
ncbi:unnamed protein product, partial [Ilex paraguariensis]